jgi:murein DD-endopeptidase MepM/ murein hydrolase activator NlpD
MGVCVGSEGRIATAALPSPTRPPPSLSPAPDHGPPAPPPLVESDRWVHPLAGPLRRLPSRGSRRFGVERDHDSPESCREGHCGVDLGDARGEPVLAVHDGVVERVVRDPGADRGGRYVRLVHQSGRLATQYMHLDEVAPGLRPGSVVRAGDRVGTVGDSGVRRSGPHLHFTVAARAHDGAETYIDPEPLLTLWPLAPARSD